MRPHVALVLLAVASCASADPSRGSPREGEFRAGFEATLCRDMPAPDVRIVDLVAYFASEAAARTAAAAVDGERFEVSVREAADRPAWLVRALYRALPTQQQLDADAGALLPRWKALGGFFAGYGCGSQPYPASRLRR